MKKIALFLTSILISAVSFSQVQFGIKGGLNVSSFHDEDQAADEDVTRKASFHVGGLAHIPLSRQFAIQPELVYSKEGAENKQPFFVGKTVFGYVNLPVLVQFKIKSNFRLETGPQIGYLTRAVLNEPDGGSGSRDIKEYFSKTSFSWSWGIGYLFRNNLGIDARFNLGLSNIYDEEGAFGTSNVRSRVGQLGLFYQFKN